MISRRRSSVRAVAAIGVGMMALHQRLEPGLDLGRGGVGFKPERVERLALGIADDAGFAAAPVARLRPRAPNSRNRPSGSSAPSNRRESR